MRSRSLSIVTVMTVVTVVAITVCTVLTAGTGSAHPTQTAGLTSSPPAALSTSGDYASDVLGDPWDFSEQGDVPPYMTLGTEGSYGIGWDQANGWLNLDGHAGSVIKLVRTWAQTLPWGHDGLLHPVDANTYNKFSFSASFSSPRVVGLRYWTEDGQIGYTQMPTAVQAGWGTYEFNLAGQPLWTGKIVRVDFAIGGDPTGGADRFTMSLDWARLHRTGAPTAPPAATPTVRITSPSYEGGADYATVSGNPWDFAGPDDVQDSNDVINVNYDGDSMHGWTLGNDSWVQLPLRTPLNTDRYHRFTADVCFDGGFGLENAPGGGMNARVIWYDVGGQAYTDSQDIVVEPGCNRMTFDLATDPAIAVDDEATAHKGGWRGLQISYLRFDLNEDPGQRQFWLRDIRLADDAAFSSGAFPISFNSTTSGTADIYVSTSEGTWNDTPIKTGLAVAAGSNTFNWDGSGLPNGTYWVNVVVHNGNNTGSAYSGGPVRIERSLPPTPSCYVPLNPYRLLDTRTGQGGNISALTTATSTELKVAGYGGVPPTGVTAVALNVTVDTPSASGYITAWPSGEPQPTVSNLNYVPGQTVPNLVTVKIGSNGRVNLFNSQGNTEVIADVVGYFTGATGGCTGRFTAVTPGRVLDTRYGIGQTAPGKVGTAQTINVKVTGVQGVPASGVSGVALNVTADSPTAEGYLTVWPTGEGQPGASSHNFVPGLTVANLVLAKVGAGGQVSIFNSAGTTHVIADVVGYFSSSGGTLIPVSPQRIVDSRYGIGRGVSGPLGPQQSINVDVAGVAPIPGNASAVIANVTSVDSTAPSFITVWPAGSTRPTASTVNPRPGLPVPNLAYLKLGSGGQLSIYNDAGATQYIVDAFAYIA